jgi:hypothetical protein
MCGPALVLEMAVGAVDQHLVLFGSSVNPSLAFWSVSASQLFGPFIGTCTDIVMCR